MARHRIFLALLFSLSASRGFPQSPSDGGPDPSQVRIRIGPLWLNPTIELSNLGVDTNVFNEAVDQNPKKDFTITVTPKTDAWLHMGRSWLFANINEHIVWYQKYSSERSANNDYLVGWKMPMNRMNVSLSGKYLNTRDRPGFEIDARSRRTEYNLQGAVEVRSFSKTFIGINAARQRVDYDKDAVFLNNNLRFELNRTNVAGGLSLRHQLTPLTSLSFGVARSEDRFEFSPLRDSNSTTATASVSFDPFALIKGGASFGYKNFQPLSPGVADYKGTTAQADLSYTLLGATRFGIQVGRDIQYSYEINQPYYLQTGFTFSIAQQVYGPFDVVARYGAQTLAYRNREGIAVPLLDRSDDVHTYGGSVGYHMGQDLRFAFNVDRIQRTSDVAQRQYEGLKYGTAVTYGF